MEIRNSIAQIFQEAQLSLSGHRKLVINLKSVYSKSVETGYEEDFTLSFSSLLNKILVLKKGEDSGDRIAKFCSIFIANLYKEVQSDGEESQEEETPHSRFVDHLIRHLLQGIQAKDRNVRYRVAQLLAYLVNFIGELDEDLFKALNWSLGRRLYDKESTVRIQAVVALSRFQFIDVEDDEEYLNDDEDLKNLNKASKLLIEILNNDESPEVRRAALLNLNKTPVTLPYLIETARDVNSVNRRLVYSRICKELGDFRSIPDTFKDKLINWGLNDRDHLVEQSAIKLFNHWFHTVDKDFVEFLENISLGNNKSPLLKKLFDLNFDNVKSFVLSRDDWKSLTIEKAFLIRNLYEYFDDKKLFNLIEEKFLESIELSEVLYKYLRLRTMKLNDNKQLREDYNEFKYNLKAIESEISQLREKVSELEALPKISTADEIVYKNSTTSLSEFEQKRTQFLTVCAPKLREYREFKEDLDQLEFIINQLLLICLNYDFSDEISRRSLLQIIRSSLTNDELSNELIEASLKVMTKISISQRDFTAMTTEIITDIRDSFMDENDETFHSAYGFDEEDDEEEEDDDDDAIDKEHEETQSQEADYTNNLNRIGNVFDDENFDKETPNKRRKIQPNTPPDNILIQCLQITQHLLEISNEPLENNYMLESLIDSLVAPAMTNSDLYIKGLSINCLGLFCLLDKELAIRKLPIFRRVVEIDDEKFKILGIKVFVDVLSTFGTSVLEPGEAFRRKREIENDIDIENEIYCNEQEDYIDSFKLGSVFYRALKNYHMPNLQAITAEGLCKLFLADIMDDFGKFKKDADKELLTALILSYFDTKNLENSLLRQTLSFCLPVYAFSHGKHQMRLAQAMDDCILRIFIGDHSNASTIVQQLIHWCDHENLVRKKDNEYAKNPLWQVVGFLKNINDDNINKSVKKVLINNLAKINLTKEIGSKLLEELKESIVETQDVIASKSQENSEFILESFVSKNLQKFHDYIEELIGEAKKWELENPDEVKDDLNDGDQEEDAEKDLNERLENAPNEEIPDDSFKNKSHEGLDEDVSLKGSGIGEVREGAARDGEGAARNEDGQEEDEEEDNNMKIDPIESDLKSIDEFLDAEDNVNYNV